jgi:hypothetical protein
MNPADKNGVLLWGYLLYRRGIEPPFFEVAEMSINLVNSSKGDTELLMPNGITKTAVEITKGMRLENWLTD